MEAERRDRGGIDVKRKKKKKDDGVIQELGFMRPLSSLSSPPTVVHFIKMSTFLFCIYIFKINYSTFNHVWEFNYLEF